MTSLQGNRKEEFTMHGRRLQRRSYLLAPQLALPKHEMFLL